MILPILRKFSPCRSLSQKYTLYKKKLSLKTLSICPSWLMKSWSGYLEGIFIGDVLTGPLPPVGSDTINLTHDHSDHHHEYTNQTKPQWSSSWLYKPNQTKPNHCDHHHYHYTNHFTRKQKLIPTLSISFRLSIVIFLPPFSGFPSCRKLFRWQGRHREILSICCSLSLDTPLDLLASN